MLVLVLLARDTDVHTCEERSGKLVGSLYLCVSGCGIYIYVCVCERGHFCVIWGSLRTCVEYVMYVWPKRDNPFTCTYV